MNPISLFLILARSLSSKELTSVPFKLYAPEVGVSRQPNKFIKVDFPLPEGPIIATYSFLFIETSMPFKARTSSEPTVNSLFNSFILIMAFDISFSFKLITQ